MMASQRPERLMQTDAVTTGPRRPALLSRNAGMVRTLGLDIIGPVILFRICRRAGLSEVWSLVVAGLLPGLGVLLDWVRFRALQVVGVVVLAGIALSVALALISDDPKVVLLEGAAVTAAFGVACVVSLAGRRPLIFHFAQAFYGGRWTADGAELDDDYERYEEARHFWRTGTTVWGITYVLEAAVLVAIIQTVSTATALTVNRTVPWVVSGLLFLWLYRRGARLQALKPTEGETSES
jgi:hypothetical protein